MKGEPANDEYKSMASLQLDGKHICSSGIFHEGFLATTGQCAWNIKYGMLDYRKATAVLGESDLKKGQRVTIVKVTYDSRFEMSNERHRNSNFDLGVVKVSRKEALNY